MKYDHSKKTNFKLRSPHSAYTLITFNKCDPTKSYKEMIEQFSRPQEHILTLLAMKNNVDADGRDRTVAYVRNFTST